MKFVSLAIKELYGENLLNSKRWLHRSEESSSKCSERRCSVLSEEFALGEWGSPHELSSSQRVLHIGRAPSPNHFISQEARFSKHDGWMQVREDGDGSAASASESLQLVEVPGIRVPGLDRDDLGSFRPGAISGVPFAVQP
eukprot:417935-Rhodomonas_salina.1